jgi:hypothetical protein
MAKPSASTCLLLLPPCVHKEGWRWRACQLDSCAAAHPVCW